MTRIVVFYTTLLLLALASVTLAQYDSGYDLSWNTVDDGGYIFSTGNGYELGGTIGQPDAGALSNANYALGGGFWSGGTAQYGIYLPLVLKSYP